MNRMFITEYLFTFRKFHDVFEIFQLFLIYKNQIKFQHM